MSSQMSSSEETASTSKYFKFTLYCYECFLLQHLFLIIYVHDYELILRWRLYDQKLNLVCFVLGLDRFFFNTKKLVNDLWNFSERIYKFV